MDTVRRTMADTIKGFVRRVWEKIFQNPAVFTTPIIISIIAIIIFITTTTLHVTGRTSGGLDRSRPFGYPVGHP